MLKTKSVHSAIEPRKDGLRILATRVRGRGLLCSRPEVWMANLRETGFGCVQKQIPRFITC